MQASLHIGSRVSCPASTSGRSMLQPGHGQQPPRIARAAAANNNNQGLRFKHIFKPQNSGDPTSWMSWPTNQLDQPNTHILEQQPDERIDSKMWWHPQGSADSVAVSNLYAQRFRVRKAALPVPGTLPGTEHWQVEMFQDYSKGWPSIQWEDGKLRLRLGFLGPVDDPMAVPYFFYKGLEQVRYTWGERVFQAAYAASYIGVHALMFSWLWSAHAPLALALGYNWALGRLSPAKWALLLLLASSGRLWLYYTFQVAKFLDMVLAKLFPPIRKFFWANFMFWMFYLVLTPSYFPPVPLAPLMPGAEGPLGPVF